jgi:hypothetical protein
MEKIYLTKEELDQLKKLRENDKTLTTAFGEIEISIQSLNVQKQNLIKSYNELKQNENRIANMLQSKYGDGTIEIETGEFIKKT